MYKRKSMNSTTNLCGIGNLSFFSIFRAIILNDTNLTTVFTTDIWFMSVVNTNNICLATCQVFQCNEYEQYMPG